MKLYVFGYAQWLQLVYVIWIKTIYIASYNKFSKPLPGQFLGLTPMN